MATRVDEQLREEIASFGTDDLSVCINCGNCTAVCSLSGQDATFPRRIIRYLQLGLKDRVLASTEPWLCYYCGECSATCPRQVEPGEIMMATRRYLTAQYDATGLAGRLYLSKTWEVVSLLVDAAFVLGLFYFFHGPMVTDHVAINTFAPVAWVEMGDWVMAFMLTAFLAANVYRMHRFIMGDVRAPWKLYAGELKEMITHFVTQKRWRGCADVVSQRRWLKHWLLVSGYLTMLVLIVVFLRWFQVDGSHWRWLDLLGYYATGVLLYVTADAMLSRLRRDEQLHKHSHPTDWMFLILLFFTSLTGILLHLFRLANLPIATYWIYAIHLAIAVPMLVIEVPFGKWSHLAYRPLAIGLHRVREQALQISAQPASAAGAVPEAGT